MPRSRLDQLLVARGLAPSREKAQALILGGQVLVKDTPVTKAGQQIDDDTEIRLRGETSKYVGRGGDKLAPALAYFGIELKDRIVADIGSSTGGFTDCALQNGAKLVYAVDVGTNQLDYKLRIDQRVVVMEQTHVKDLLPSMFNSPPSIVLADLSFIGVSKILGYIKGIIESGARVLVLVKPQFELDPEYVEKGGVVTDPEHQLEAVARVVAAGRALGLDHRGTVPSALKGAKSGNQEYFVLFYRP